MCPVLSQGEREGEQIRVQFNIVPPFGPPSLSPWLRTETLLTSTLQVSRFNMLTSEPGREKGGNKLGYNLILSPLLVPPLSLLCSEVNPNENQYTSLGIKLDFPLRSPSKSDWSSRFDNKWLGDLPGMHISPPL